jgi:hypothetical protein
MKNAMLIGEIIVSLIGAGIVFWMRFADEAEPSEHEEHSTPEAGNRPNCNEIENGPPAYRRA